MITILQGGRGFFALYKNNKLVFVGDKHYAASDFERNLNKLRSEEDEDVVEQSDEQFAYYDQFPEDLDELADPAEGEGTESNKRPEISVLNKVDKLNHDKKVQSLDPNRVSSDSLGSSGLSGALPLEGAYQPEEIK